MGCRLGRANGLRPTLKTFTAVWAARVEVSSPVPRSRNPRRIASDKRIACAVHVREPLVGLHDASTRPQILALALELGGDGVKPVGEQR
ncbi:MAG: hypothetical protein QOI01_32 [Mycobacterium sp.]|jgi:hypothetical protein|nr:hypothetical protein [Mycobacterium sp.]